MPKKSKKSDTSFAQRESARQKRHQENLVRLASEHVQTRRELEEATVGLRAEKAQNQLLLQQISQLQTELAANKNIVSALQGQSIKLQDKNVNLQKDVNHLIDLANQIHAAGVQQMQRARTAEAAGRDIFAAGTREWIRAEGTARQNARLLQGLQAAITAFQLQQARMADFSNKLIETGQQLNINPGALIPIQNFANALEIQKNFKFSDNPDEANKQLAEILQRSHDGITELAASLNEIQREIAVRAQQARQAQQQLQAQQADISRLERQQEEERRSFQASQAEAAQALIAAKEEASAALQQEQIASAAALDRAQQDSLNQIRQKDTEINRLSEELARASQRQEISSRRINVLSREAAMQRSSAEEASENLAAALIREQELNQEQEAILAQRNELQQALNRLQQEEIPRALHEVREQDRTIMQQEISSLTNQLQAIQQEKNSLQQQTQERRSELAVSEDQRAFLIRQLEDLQQERDQLRQQFQALQDQSRRQLQAARFAQQRAEEHLNENIQNQDAQRRLAQAENEIRVLQAQLQRQPPPPPARIDLLPPPHFIEIRSRTKRHYGITRNPIFFETFEPSKILKKPKTPIKKLFSRYAGF